MTRRASDVALAVTAALAAVTAALPLGVIAALALLPTLGHSSARLQPSPISPVPTEFLGTWPLLAASLAWAIGPAVAAALLAWGLAALLAPRVAAGRGLVALTLALVPAFVPGYLAFWALWICVGPGTALGDVVLRHGLATEARTTALTLAIVGWSVPYALVPIVARRLLMPDPDAALRRLDGATSGTRLAAAFRHDAPALVAGVACATIAILSENVAFDLAQIRTYGYELRTLDATGATPATVVRLGWPGILASVALVAVVAFAWRRAPSRRSGPPVVNGRRATVGGAASLVVACILLAPLAAVVVRAASSKAIHEFVVLYGGAATTSAALALTAGGLVGLGAVGCALAWNDPRRGRRLVARGAATVWIVAAASPATLIALGLETTFNHALTAAVYDGPVIVFLGLVARVGVVAAVVAPFAAALESRRTRDLRALDGTESLGGVWRVRRPVLVGAFLLAASAGSALAFGELATTARLRPPAIDVLATSTLNAIHYQQPETVLLAATISAAIGLLVAAIFARAAIRPLARIGAVLVVAAVGLAGCREATGPHDAGTPPLPVTVAFGSPGFGPGQFRTPRVLAVEPKTGCIFVIDKEARVQRFSPEGVFETEWAMPAHVQGCPVGISIHPDGRVFISDTHYHRIMVFDRDGHELGRFGQFGKGPGEFIYPTDIAFHPDGRIYVAEYGSNDRIQVFDASFRPIAAFGSMGAEEGQFGRPQSIVFDPLRNELYVADSNNHRIVVTDPDGRWLRTFGSIGTGPGELAYPRGLILVGDGTVLVNEFGNHRIQHLDARPGTSFGASLGMWGGPATGSRSETGVSTGSLQYPWDLDGTMERFAVTDSATDRVVVSGIPKSN